MQALIRTVFLRLLALLTALSLLFAQGGAQAQSPDAYSQQELEQMMAPIALYPDPLLSHILLAASYPMEILEAARWSGERPELSGEDAVRAAEGENWDPSVKALLAFPQVLASMSENPQWMQSLGNAFLAQQAQVMDTVQELRRRAQAAGELRSDDHVNLVANGPDLLLQPLDPRVVYVPYYDPLIAFGSWRWPAYPPVYLRPWQRHYARPGFARGTFWGPPVAVSVGFFFGAFDWPRRQLLLTPGKTHRYSHGRVANRPRVPNRAPGAWRHEAEQRAGIVQSGVAPAQRLIAPGAPASQHLRIGIARPDERREHRAAVPTQTRPDARIDSRPESRVVARPTAPAPVVQPAPAAPLQIRPESRFDGRRETRGVARPIAPTAVVQAAPAAPVARIAPAPRPAPLVQPAAVARPAPVAAPAPAIQPRPQVTGHTQRPHHEGQRAGSSARDARSSQAAPRQGAGAHPGARPPGGR